MSRFRSQQNPAEPAHETDLVPAVLPHVAMTVHQDDTMSVTVDGKPFEPEPPASSWRRGAVATILDAITAQHRSPVRVEVRETDGTVFTDIITPARPQRPEPDPAPDVPTKTPEPPELATVCGEGFVSGEQVAAAIVIGHVDAAADGTVRARFTPAQVAASPTGEVILLGRVSGILTVGRPQ